MQGVNYNSSVCPPDYKCGVCGVYNVKLWREYQTVHTELFCAECAAKNQGKNISDMGSDGRYSDEYGKTDQIGWLVPAVPDEEGHGFWGYTSVPPEGVNWWRNLSK